MTSPDETPTPKLTERHLAFRGEALRVAEELGARAASFTRDPHNYDFEEARFARAMQSSLELLARRFERWTLGNTSSEKKQRQLMQLQALVRAAGEFCAEHEKR